MRKRRRHERELKRSARSTPERRENWRRRRRRRRSRAWRRSKPSTEAGGRRGAGEPLYPGKGAAEQERLDAPAARSVSARSRAPDGGRACQVEEWKAAASEKTNSKGGRLGARPTRSARITDDGAPRWRRRRLKADEARKELDARRAGEEPSDTDRGSPRAARWMSALAVEPRGKGEVWRRCELAGTHAEAAFRRCRSATQQAAASQPARASSESATVEQHNTALAQALNLCRSDDVEDRESERTAQPLRSWRCQSRRIRAAAGGLARSGSRSSSKRSSSARRRGRACWPRKRSRPRSFGVERAQHAATKRESQNWLRQQRRSAGGARETPSCARPTRRWRTRRAVPRND